MNAEPSPDAQELTGDIVRALVLYSLAEHQAGHATTLQVTAQGLSFSVADDGRGHAIHKLVAGQPYLQFIYTHLDYPFDNAEAAPVQLQGIGMSLVNTLCSELAVTVRKPDATLRVLFSNGRLHSQELQAVPSTTTGNTLSGKVHAHLQAHDADNAHLQRWLLRLLVANPSLKLFFNGQALQAPHTR
jgi:DNA gyrase/topoisomerase IV subunit B